MFKTMQGCLKDNKINREESKKIIPWIFNRYISGVPEGMMYSSLANQFDLDSFVLYEYYRTSLKDKKIKFIKYYKDDKMIEDIDFLMGHYNCSRAVAEEYYDLLNENQINEMKQSYGGRK